MKVERCAIQRGVPVRGASLPLCFIGAVSLTTALLSSTARAEDFDVVARGCFTCLDRSVAGHPDELPLAGATVYLMDSDVQGSHAGDDEMGSAVIGPDGCFEIAGRGGDPWLGDDAKPDVYLRVALDGYVSGPPIPTAALTSYRIRIRLHNEGGSQWDTNTPEHDHDNTSGAVDFGSWQNGGGHSDGTSSRCALWIAARTVLQQYVDNVPIRAPFDPDDDFDIKFWDGVFTGTPYTYRSTINWPRNAFGDGGYPATSDPGGITNPWGLATMRHEIGHALRHSWDGDMDHWNGDDGLYTYGAEHAYETGKKAGIDNNGFAFNEGWAHYWNNRTYHTSAMGNREDLEGNVAHGLQVLAEDCALGDHVLETDPWKRKHWMARVLENHPGAIHSYTEFRDALEQDYGYCAAPLHRPLASPPVEPENAPTVSYAQHAAVIDRQLAALASAVERVKAELAAAAAAARREALPPCTPDDCRVATEAVLAPHFIRLTQRQLELERARLLRLRDERTFAMWPKQTSEESARAESAREAHERLRVGIEAFDGALAALRPLTGTSHGAAEMAAKLTTRRADLAQRLASGAAPPSYLGLAADVRDDAATPVVPPRPPRVACGRCAASGGVASRRDAIGAGLLLGALLLRRRRARARGPA